MANCVKCGKKIGGFGGVSGPDITLLDKFRLEGHAIPNPICGACSRTYIEKIVESPESKVAPQHFGPPVSVSTIVPYLHGEFSIISTVSAHVALGTGPISQILSSFTDLFGQESNAYSEKMQEAEQACLTKLKINAHAMGADAVVGMRTTYTELTAGHGMLLVCMTGTAVKVNKE